MAHSATLPQPGDLIAGKYRIERALSEGGMGAVYVARHTATERAFALKLMRPELAGDAEAETRFMREARLAGAIEHPAIIEVYDVGRHGSFPYMVMKLLEGESLGERIKRGPIEPAKALRILLPVLDGIVAAHARGVVHRDLKPDNIFLCAEGDEVVPKILDFGISKLIGSDASTLGLTATGIALGTPLYMSPEQVRGARDVDARTDVYALGVILYQMLSGALPYEATNYAELVLKIISGRPEPVRQRNPAIAPELDAIVSRAMAVERDDRYPDVDSFSRELAALHNTDLSISTRRSAVTAPTTRTPFTADVQTPALPRRKAPAWAAAVTAAVLLLALGAWALWPTAQQAPPPTAQAGAPPVAAPPPAAPSETPVQTPLQTPTPEATAEPEPEAEPEAEPEVPAADNEETPAARETSTGRAAERDARARRNRHQRNQRPPERSLRIVEPAPEPPPAAPPAPPEPPKRAPREKPQPPSFEIDDEGLIDPFKD